MEIGFGQSELGSVLVNEFDDTPEAMAAVVGKYLSSPSLLHGDIDPLFEDVVVTVLRWIGEGQASLVQDFLGRLTTLILSQPKYEMPSAWLTPEKHLLVKLGTLVNIMGTALRITMNPTPRPKKPRRRRRA